jgi:hypothetical protein
MMASEAHDATVIAEAKKLADAWLADHGAVDANTVDSVLQVAAQNGDRALYDRWVTAAKKEQDRPTRRRLIEALAAFRDEKIVAGSLAMLLTDAFELREATPILWSAAEDRFTRKMTWKWLQTNFDALVAKLPRDGGAWLPHAAISLCDDAAAQEVKGFFAERARKFEGGPRHLDQALEQMHLCSVFRTAQSPHVHRYFSAPAR